MFTTILRASRVAVLAVLAVVLAALCAPSAVAHDGPHFSFDAASMLVQGLEPTDALEQSTGRASVAQAAALSPAQVFGDPTKVECVGTGTGGKRVQVMYVRDVDTADGYAASKASIGAWAVGLDRIYRVSAAKTDGHHRVRFVHDAFCNLSILNVVVDDVNNLTTPANTMGPLDDLVAALGYNDPDRKYVMFVDNATTVCGVGTVVNDDSPGQGNLSNGGPNGSSGYTRIDFDKTGCNPEDWIAAHELGHNLGAVQPSAPNSTGQFVAGKFHCIDDADRLCQDDGSNQLATVCTGPNAEAELDCNEDDYFNANPPAGSYLDTHWNLADSDFLASEPGDHWAFVRANEPTTASYTPSLDFNRNSTGAANTVARVSTGTYAVTFTNLANHTAPFGVVLATAVGTAGEFCNAAWWSSTSADLVATIDCFDAAGNRADVEFDASLIRPISTSGDYAYLWADHPTWTVPYTPSTTHQFNSTGALNEITRTATGDYEVRLPGLGGVDGAVKVTAFSSFDEFCKVKGWSSSGGDKFVDVLCFDVAGAPVDVNFTLAFARELSILGSGAANGYVWANDANVALATPYTPDVDYQHNSTGASNTVTRSARGVYRVSMPGLGVPFVGANRGTVHATAFGTTSHRCEVTNWFGGVGPIGNPSPLSVDVACHTAAGAAVDARFVLQYTQ